MEETIDKLHTQRVKQYAENSAKIASSIQALAGSDGWQIFLALWKRRKDEIKEKTDYTDLVQFKADRLMIDMMNELFTEMEGFVSDASEAQRQLSELSPDQEKPRGIMLIESMEGANKEA